jgi:hypothetical protein
METNGSTVKTSRNHHLTSTDETEHAALLRAVVQAGRMLAGGARQDFELAEDAFIRLGAITRGAPNLVPTLTADTGPIHVEAELRAVAALTRHHWKHRLNILVDVPATMPPFWCRWWIARVAAMRLVMLAAESQQRSPSNMNLDRLPRLHLAGRLEGAQFEFRLWFEPPAVLSLSTTDSVLALCAKCLDAEIVAATKPSGDTLIALRYPVRLAGPLSESAGK